MNQKAFLLMVFTMLLLLATQESYGQLLEDRNKLKTATKKRDGFFPQKRKAKSSVAHGRPKVEKARKPKFTQSTAGSGSAYNVKPRYSKASKSKSKYAVQPRYSRNVAGNFGRTQKVNPRFSQKSPGRSGKAYKVSPRFSQGSTEHGRIAKINPRFTQQSAGNYGRKWNVNPRFSQGSTESRRVAKINPRFSQGSTEGRKVVKINPRFTQQSAGSYGRKWKINPRFSQGSTEGRKVVKVNPRFSEDRNAGAAGHGVVVSPRFTQEKAGDYGRQAKVNPRFTPASRGGFFDRPSKVKPRFSEDRNAGASGHKVAVSPRFTQEKAGEYKKTKISPRFSPGNVEGDRKQKVNPRFTKDLAGDFGNKRVRTRRTKNLPGDVGHVRVNPRFSIPPDYAKKTAINQRGGFLTTVNLMIDHAKYKKQHEPGFVGPKVKPGHGESHDVSKYNENIKSYSKHTKGGVMESANFEMATYTGKIRKQKRTSDMHPSVRYLSAKGDNSKTIRDTKRKANVAWVRMFGNQTQPKAVKEKVGKVKFDKDEKEIWNN